MNPTTAVGVHLPVLLGTDLFNVQVPDWVAKAMKSSPSLAIGALVFYLAFKHIAKSHQAPHRQPYSGEGSFGERKRQVAEPRAEEPAVNCGTARRRPSRNRSIKAGKRNEHLPYRPAAVWRRLRPGGRGPRLVLSRHHQSALGTARQLQQRLFALHDKAILLVAEGKIAEDNHDWNVDCIMPSTTRPRRLASAK